MTAPKPSVAIRSSAEPEAAVPSKLPYHAVVAPATAPRGGAQLQFFLGCPPFLPKILLDLSHTLLSPYDPTPSPPEEPLVCRPPLAARFVSPCAAFLTNSSVSAPSRVCCDNVRSFFGDSSASLFCLCHVANGDVDPMLPAPVVDPACRVAVIVNCKEDFDTDYVNEVCDKDSTYREYVPPMDPPSPPPAPGKKA